MFKMYLKLNFVREHPLCAGNNGRQTGFVSQDSGL